MNVERISLVGQRFRSRRGRVYTVLEEATGIGAFFKEEVALIVFVGAEGRVFARPKMELMDPDRFTLLVPDKEWTVWK